jgi:endonuclease/exonuclease/phosphatase family metal-dependent hydrolase
MRFTILNWNVGGAKVLEQQNEAKRDEIKLKINEALNGLLTDPNIAPKPDIVTLQEIVQWQQPSDIKPNDLLDPIPGYEYYPYRLIDSKMLSASAKWRKIKRNKYWHPDTYFAQGNAFLIKKDAPLFPIWDLSKPSRQKPATSNVNCIQCIESVHLDSGLYFGDRDSEPRAALVTHFIFEPNNDSKPLDIFVINVHLTTLMMEREGVPEIDTKATKIRQNQLDVVFYGIVSRYNSWRRGGYRHRGNKRKADSHETFDRYSPIWIVAGDFNFTEESAEYAFIKSMNFIDTVPEAGKKTPYGYGTKTSGVGNDPTLNLDYIFLGPKYVSFDQAIVHTLHSNRVIHDHIYRASDHYPILTSLEPMPK